MGGGDRPAEGTVKAATIEGEAKASRIRVQPRATSGRAASWIGDDAPVHRSEPQERVDRGLDPAPDARPQGDARAP